MRICHTRSQDASRKLPQCAVHCGKQQICLACCLLLFSLFHLLPYFLYLLKCSPDSSSLNSFCSSHLLSPSPVSLSYLFPFGIFPCSSLEGLLAAVLFGHSLSCSCRDLVLHQSLCTSLALCAVEVSASANSPQEKECPGNIFLCFSKH